jgi:hypothetical protein
MAQFTNAQEKWNRRFSTENYVFGKQVNHYLAAQKDRLHPGKALAIADGEGRNSVWLAQHGLQVDAFDFSQIAIDKAQQLANENAVSVNYMCSDWQNFAWNEKTYDYVVGIFFQFADPQSRTEIFRRMNLSLKSGGLLIIQGYAPKQMEFNTGGPGVLDNLYTEELIHSSFSNYQILDSCAYEKHIEEGDGHVGMSALIGFVGKKLD